MFPIGLGNLSLHVLADQNKPQPTSISDKQLVSKAKAEEYILGPGDAIYVELLGITELDISHIVGPDGNIYLSRLRALNVEGLTIKDLRILLTEKYRQYVQDPVVEITPIIYRPIRVYVDGEVQRPGSYILSNNQGENTEFETSPLAKNLSGEIFRSNFDVVRESLVKASVFPNQFPTLFDAIRAADGITPYSDLANVEVSRKVPIKRGGGIIKTNVNFLQMITEGDESVNIRLLDGDVIKVNQTSEILIKQLMKAGKTNLNPKTLLVFVGGRVRTAGAIQVPQGAALNQAILVAGGAKLLRGKVEFVRFYKDGRFKRKLFSYSPNAKIDSPSNPILMAGDVIRIRDSALSAGFEVINEIATPATGIYSVYKLFGFGDD